MKKMFLVFLFASSAQAATNVDVPKMMRQYQIPVEWDNGINWATIQEPSTGEIVKIGFYGNGPEGKPSNSIGLLYEGFSYYGGMYGLGYLSGMLSSCLQQTQTDSKGSDIFIKNSVEQALKNGSGTFARKFGKNQYIVTGDHYANGKIRIRLVATNEQKSTARCIL